MSGLAAAHELIERGFSVDVFESRNVMGGKARSFGVPGSAGGGRAQLPAEHGFRFFPGFYRNVPDSMKRIPYGKNGHVLSNLRDLAALNLGGGGTGGFGSSAPSAPQADRSRLTEPGYLSDLIGQTVASLTGNPAVAHSSELAGFVNRTLVYVTSSMQRRTTDFERIGWWDYLGADRKSKWFQDNIVKGTTIALVAVKPDVASVFSAGNIIESFLWNAVLPLPGPDDARIMRMLSGPTSNVWITPWVAELKRLGVRFHTGQALQTLDTSGGQISGASVTGGAVDADYYVCAFPIDRAVNLLRTPELLRLDPKLNGIKDLKEDWMNGLQIYLTRAPKARLGMFGSVEHPWTLSAVLQSNLWNHSIPHNYGNGKVKEVVSVDISTWDARGTLTTRKPARACTAEEIFTEVWACFKQQYAGEHDPAFSDASVHSWFLDPSITWGSDGMARNDEPLTVQTVNTWAKRPHGATAIPNLFVAGDWTQTNMNVCTMEGGNQSGRTAAQAVLDAAGSNAERVTRYDYYVPSQLDGLKRLDAQRHAAGQRNIFDT